MRCLVVVCLVLWSEKVLAGQPNFIRLDPNGMSYIYPVMDSSDWLLTQPNPSRMFDDSDNSRVTHWEDEYYAQDWARGCGQTYGLRLYAGISGQVVYAGARGPYGNTVVIYDKETKFALKYSHLSEINVAKNEFVLAGKSLIGRVGNTGNVQSTGCSSHPGAHLHLVLFKNVQDPNARPITTTAASSGSRRTQYAAPFQYVTSVELGKLTDDPTVYAMYYGTRVPISAQSFESHGWNFDKQRVLLDPLAGRVHFGKGFSSIPQAYYAWPMRDNTLLKSTNQATVYQFEDGQKYALTYSVFQCRGLRFNEVREVSAGERDMYGHVKDIISPGCEIKPKQALADLIAFATQNRFGSVDLSSYQVYPDWNPSWELRWLSFLHSSGKRIELYHSSSISDPKDRQIGYWDPGSGAWNGWHRVP